MEDKKAFITKTLEWLKTRLGEPSTLTWLIALAGYIGYTIDPESLEKIVGVCVALIGVIQIIMKDPVTAIKDLTKSIEDETGNEVKTEDGEKLSGE